MVSGSVRLPFLLPYLLLFRLLRKRGLAGINRPKEWAYWTPVFLVEAIFSFVHLFVYIIFRLRYSERSPSVKGLVSVSIALVVSLTPSPLSEGSITKNKMFVQLNTGLLASCHGSYALSSCYFLPRRRLVSHNVALISPVLALTCPQLHSDNTMYPNCHPSQSDFASLTVRRPHSSRTQSSLARRLSLSLTPPFDQTGCSNTLSNNHRSSHNSLHLGCMDSKEQDQ